MKITRKLLLFEMLVAVTFACQNAFSITPEEAAINRLSTPLQSCVLRPNAKVPWRYCVYEYPNHSNNVLYYFHGINGNEHSWKYEKFERSIVRRWVEKGEKPPIVVSISFGQQWFLVEKNSSSKSGLYEIFVNQLMREVQKRYTFQVDENWLMGVSMGGFNASQMYFKNTGMFTRAAIICGAMTTVSPFASAKEVAAYKARTGASPLLVGISINISKSFMPTPHDWELHSPIILALKGFSPQSIPLYVSNGTGDIFGFDEGNKIFSYIAWQKGAPIESHFYPGRGHCDVDAKPIADFFMRKEELLPETPTMMVETPVATTDPRSI